MVNRNSRVVMVPVRSPWPSFQGAKGGHWRGSIVSPPPLPTRKRARGKEAEEGSNQNPTPFFSPFPNVSLSSSPNNIHSSLDALVSAIFTSIAYSDRLLAITPNPPSRWVTARKKNSARRTKSRNAASSLNCRTSMARPLRQPRLDRYAPPLARPSDSRREAHRFAVKQSHPSLDTSPPRCSRLIGPTSTTPTPGRAIGRPSSLTLFSARTGGRSSNLILLSTRTGDRRSSPTFHPGAIGNPPPRFTLFELFSPSCHIQLPDRSSASPSSPCGTPSSRRRGPTGTSKSRRTGGPTGTSTNRRPGGRPGTSKSCRPGGRTGTSRSLRPRTPWPSTPPKPTTPKPTAPKSTTPKPTTPKSTTPKPTAPTRQRAASKPAAPPGTTILA